MGTVGIDLIGELGNPVPVLGRVAQCRQALDVRVHRGVLAPEPLDVGGQPRGVIQQGIEQTLAALDLGAVPGPRFSQFIERQGGQAVLVQPGTEHPGNVFEFGAFPPKKRGTGSR